MEEEGEQKFSSERKRKRGAREQEGECAGVQEKMEEEEGKQPEEWGNGRDGKRERGVKGLQGCVGRELGY